MRNFDEPLLGGPDNQAEEDGKPLGAAENEAPEPEQPVEVPRGYVVNPNHRPGLTDRSGSIRADHVGAVGIERLAPAFDVARRRELLTAARAINELDAGVDENHINLDPRGPSRERVEQRILDKLEEELPYLTPADTLSVNTDRSRSVDPPQPGTPSRALAKKISAKKAAAAKKAAVRKDESKNAPISE